MDTGYKKINIKVQDSGEKKAAVSRSASTAIGGNGGRVPGAQVCAWTCYLNRRDCSARLSIAPSRISLTSSAMLSSVESWVAATTLMP